MAIPTSQFISPKDPLSQLIAMLTPVTPDVRNNIPQAMNVDAPGPSGSASVAPGFSTSGSSGLSQIGGKLLNGDFSGAFGNVVGANGGNAAAGANFASSLGSAASSGLSSILGFLGL